MLTKLNDLTSPASRKRISAAMGLCCTNHKHRRTVPQRRTILPNRVRQRFTHFEQTIQDRAANCRLPFLSFVIL